MNQTNNNVHKIKLRDILMNPDFLIPAFITVGLFVGGILYGFKLRYPASMVWFATLVIGSLPLVYRILKVLKKGKVGVDAIAIAAIFASFWADEYLAGVVILLMLSTGEALEAFAQAKAKSELTHLMNKAPSVAHRKRPGSLEDIKVDEVVIGDILVVKPGEVVPVDGIVVSGISNLDEAVITGESLPVEKKPGSQVYSGAVNQDKPLEIRSIKTSAESKYQIIVQLVREAQNAQSPTVRLADRYALFFNIVTFGAAAIAWLISHDPTRVLSVLVVASPCPLILAAPIAIISGISKAASRGIVIKNGTALEKLGEVKGLLFDKTGTLTIGVPEVVKISSESNLSETEILRLAVSADQLSVHIFARSLVQYGQKQNLELEYPEKFEEQFGRGVTALLGGKTYYFGKLAFLKENNISFRQEISEHHKQFQDLGQTAVYLADDKDLLGFIVFADVVRDETRHMFEMVAKHRLTHTIMLTGDKESVAKNIAQNVGITDYRAELLPEQKVAAVKDLQTKYGPMAMVGDGVNDAPALVAASVGIAMGSHGATAASDASDVVIMVNDIERVHDAIHVAQNAMRLAKQSIFFGMGASLLFILFAVFGLITPIFGAVLQELLDVVAITNALRVNFQKID